MCQRLHQRQWLATDWLERRARIDADVASFVNSIFSRLFGYRPRPDRLPEEDFFTETFAGVLQKSNLLQTELVRWLIEQEVHEVDLKTQKTFDDGGRVDIWIDALNCRSGARHVVAMENKIGAQEGPNQLEGYASELQLIETADSRTLVYATRHERSEAQDFPDAPDVEFRQIHWFQVADWLSESTTRLSRGGNDPSIPFVRELISLMKDWNMTMNLSVGDLAAATAYHRSAEDQLRQILSQIESACLLPSARGRWERRHSNGYLYYISPRIDDHREIKVEFGFDFKRDDTEWSVRRLGLPSAYFTVWGNPPLDFDDLQHWQIPPTDWASGYQRAKHLANVSIDGRSLQGVYLDFLHEARAEIWQILFPND